MARRYASTSTPRKKRSVSAVWQKAREWRELEVVVAFLGFGDTGLIAETPIMWSHVTINGHFSLAFSCLRGSLCEYQIATGHRTWRTRRKAREGYIWCEGYLMSSLWSSKLLLIHPDTSRSISHLSIFATIYPGSYQSSLMWRMSTPASLCSSSPQPSERQWELFNGSKGRTYFEKPGNRH